MLVGSGQGGRSLGEQGAGGLRETGEERAGSGREIQKASFSYLSLLIIQSKKQTQQSFLTSIKCSPRLKAKFYIQQKSKNAHPYSG